MIEKVGVDWHLASFLLETFLDASQCSYHNCYYLCSRVQDLLMSIPKFLYLVSLSVSFHHYVVVHWDHNINEKVQLVLLVVDNYVWAVCTGSQVGKHTHVPHDDTAVSVPYWLWDIFIPFVGHFNTKFLQIIQCN